MENWKDKIITSMEGAERARPAAGSFLKIQEKIAKQALDKSSAPRQWMAIAAVISFILCANIALVNNYYGKSVNTEVNSSEFDLISSYNIYGNE